MMEEERKREKNFVSFCCKLYWICCLCDYFVFFSIFLRLMNTVIDRRRMVQNQKLWLTASKEESLSNVICKKKTSSRQTSFRFAIWHATPYHVTPHTVNIQMKMSSSSSPSFIDYLSCQNFSQVKLFIVYGFHVISFVESWISSFSSSFSSLFHSI